MKPIPPFTHIQIPLINAPFPNWDMRTLFEPDRLTFKQLWQLYVYENTPRPKYVPWAL